MHSVSSWKKDKVAGKQRCVGWKMLLQLFLENLIFHSANNSNTGPPIQKHENNLKNYLRTNKHDGDIQLRRY